MRRERGNERGDLHLVTLIAAGCVVGVGVALLARSFAGGSCSGSELSGYGSSCAGLVSSLSLRVGAVAAVATVFMGLLNAGLARTAEQLEEVNRALSIEKGEREGRRRRARGRSR